MELIARTLPPDEWAAKLVGTSLEGMPLNPEHALVVVVEQDGVVVACWSAQTVVHVEGLWEKDGHRGGAGVGRALLTHMVAELLKAGVVEAITQSDSSPIDAMLEKVGARRVPGIAWVLPLHTIGG